MKYEAMWHMIGHTPVIKLTRFSTNKVAIFAKLEGNNPTGSIKDRVALSMIIDAQQKGLLKTGSVIIEPTSGNTGIGLAALCSALGYSFIAVMPENVSIERQKLIRAFGATIILTDGPKGTNYAIKVAHEICANNPDYVMLDQFENRANPQIHYQTTGPEIVNAVPEITHFVAGMGTGGTLMGIGHYLKEYNPAIQIIGVEPRPFSTIQGLRNMTAYKPPLYDESKLDQKFFMERDEWALELARDIFKKEGLSVGMSSGAALWGAQELAKTIDTGVIVTIFPDRGDRYASTSLFLDS